MKRLLSPPNSPDGVRIVLKAMGREPFPPARGTGAVDTIASEEQVAACRWGYQCSVCLLAGDLLCCEVRGGWELDEVGVAAKGVGGSRSAAFLFSKPC